MRKPTIYDNLAAKLGRNPTNEECKAECFRILNEAAGERVTLNEKRKG